MNAYLQLQKSIITFKSLQTSIDISDPKHFKP